MADVLFSKRYSSVVNNAGCLSTLTRPCPSTPQFSNERLATGRSLLLINRLNTEKMFGENNKKGGEEVGEAGKMVVVKKEEAVMIV